MWGYILGIKTIGRFGDDLRYHRVRQVTFFSIGIRKVASYGSVNPLPSCHLYWSPWDVSEDANNCV